MRWESLRVSPEFSDLLRKVGEVHDGGTVDHKDRLEVFSSSLTFPFHSYSTISDIARCEIPLMFVP